MGSKRAPLPGTSSMPRFSKAAATCRITMSSPVVWLASTPTRSIASLERRRFWKGSNSALTTSPRRSTSFSAASRSRRLRVALTSSCCCLYAALTVRSREVNSSRSARTPSNWAVRAATCARNAAGSTTSTLEGYSSSSSASVSTSGAASATGSVGASGSVGVGWGEVEGVASGVSLSFSVSMRMCPHPLQRWGQTVTAGDRPSTTPPAEARAVPLDEKVLPPNYSPHRFYRTFAPSQRTSESRYRGRQADPHHDMDGGHSRCPGCNSGSPRRSRRRQR